MNRGHECIRWERKARETSWPTRSEAGLSGSGHLLDQAVRMKEKARGKRSAYWNPEGFLELQGSPGL